MREEPRPDRLPQIKRRYLTISSWHLHDAPVDIAWLVAEVERLRAELSELNLGPQPDGSRRTICTFLPPQERPPLVIGDADD